MPKVHRSKGSTPSEALLASLCEQTFLDLWSYPNPYKAPGKELCDLLVVCGDDVILFSEKTIAFQDSGDECQDWRRWFKKAVINSIKQLRGAERSIQSANVEVYADNRAKHALLVPLPDVTRRRLHRVVVANGAAERCMRHYGGTGSLRITTAIPRDESGLIQSVPLFSVGDLDPSDTFVHVFDSFNLPVVLTEVDTITDFVRYLREKERLFRSGIAVAAHGEEDLLAFYLQTTDDNHEHTFFGEHLLVDGEPLDLFALDGEWWSAMSANPQYVAKKKADEISYSWDDLIRRFTQHKIRGTSTEIGAAETDPLNERGVLYMALEPRLARRGHAQSLSEAIAKAPAHSPTTRMIGSANSTDPTRYVFLQFPHHEPLDRRGIYREARVELLHAYCLVTMQQNPELLHVVGIATEPPLHYGEARSEEMVVIEREWWDEKMDAEATRLRELYKIYDPKRMRPGSGTVREYPS